MAREGEESQDDSSKIRSVENILGDPILILIFLYLFTSSHENMSWENAKTHKLDKQAKQPISCAEGENSTKNWNFQHESTSWVFHVGL